MDRNRQDVSRQQVLSTERTVLRALCTGLLHGSARHQAMSILDAYAFRDVIHQLIFDALKDIRTGQPELIRQQLPARLTQKGFPEVDFEQFLTPPGLSGSEVLALVSKMLAAARGEESADQRR